jgi:hypothetical protein
VRLSEARRAQPARSSSLSSLSAQRDGGWYAVGGGGGLAVECRLVTQLDGPVRLYRYIAQKILAQVSTGQRRPAQDSAVRPVALSLSELSPGRRRRGDLQARVAARLRPRGPSRAD